MNSARRPEKKTAAQIHAMAEVLGMCATVSFVLAFIAAAACGVIAMTISYPDDPTPKLELSGAAVVAFAGSGFWLFLIAQIVYIRANTHKD